MECPIRLSVKLLGGAEILLLEGFQHYARIFNNFDYFA